jgi:outer membrane autotransporter protein
VDYVPSSEDQTGTATGSILDLGAFYKAGPIWAGVGVYSEAENETGGSLEKQLVHFGIHYNLGFATLGLGYHNFTIDGDDVNSGMNVIAAFPLSEQMTLGVNVQTLTDEVDNSGDLTQVAVGVNYQLSKMTSVYARYVSLDGDDLADGVTTMLAGLRVNF